MTDQAAPRPEPSAFSKIVWAVISTALLAAWLGWQMGWVVALAGVVGVFVHEYGHVLAMDALGCGPGRIQIIPFLGGAAIPRIPPATEFKGVLIALAGPVFGLLAMAPFYIAFSMTGEGRWLGGAFFIAFISLLNMAPAPPLDGSKAIGPALARINPWVERIAMVVVGAAAILWAVNRGSNILAIFLALGVFSAFRRGSLRPSAMRLTGPEWLMSVGLYAAALVLCVAALMFTLNGIGAEPGLQPVLRIFGA